jgi:hypothetical protein
VTGDDQGERCGRILDAVTNAKVIEPSKPPLLVAEADPDQTVAALREVLASDPLVFDRGGAVRLVVDPASGTSTVRPLTPESVILLTHQLSRPVKRIERAGQLIDVPVRLPKPVASMVLDAAQPSGLRPFNGICRTPLLQEDGSIHCFDGYHAETGFWCEGGPDVSGLVPDAPGEAEARTALVRLRAVFRTVSFGDGILMEDREEGCMVVDRGSPPGLDESAFLCALLTAVCRPSLPFAPGVLVRAAQMSGAGAGKGLLVRCIALIAFGAEPHAVSGGGSREELEKRIASELIEAGPVLFVDNMNGVTLRSDLLASVVTERPVRVRLLGRSQMVRLNASALVTITGNGLTVAEDLARRFIAIDLDPRVENPENRRFREDLKAEVRERRSSILADLLTIWRWGRLSRPPAGVPLGSFEVWCRWVRDPLVALGCRDPVARIAETKALDGQRQGIAELFSLWWRHHQDRPIALRDLDEAVRATIDPQGRGRQYVAARLTGMVGTRMAGFVMTRQEPAGKWGAATFALGRTGSEPVEGHHAPYAPYAVGNPTREGHEGIAPLQDSCRDDRERTGGGNHRGHGGHRAAECGEEDRAGSASGASPWSARL